MTWKLYVTNKQEDTTQNIETESVNIRLPGRVIQRSEIATVSLPRPRLDSEGGSVADISE